MTIFLGMAAEEGLMACRTLSWSLTRMVIFFKEITSGEGIILVTQHG